MRRMPLIALLGILAVDACLFPSAWSEAEAEVQAEAKDGRHSVVGFWAGEESILEVALVGDGLSARVFALTNPVYQADEQDGPAGAVRLDDRNQDEALRQRPVLGLELLSGYRYDDGRWQGKIYDPKTGNTYNSRMWVDAEGRLKRKDGPTVPVFVSVSAVKEAHGEIVNWISMIQDLSERRNAEDQLRRADRLSSVGTFAAGIAPEVYGRAAAALEHFFRGAYLFETKDTHGAAAAWQKAQSLEPENAYYRSILRPRTR